VALIFYCDGYTSLFGIFNSEALSAFCMRRFEVEIINHIQWNDNKSMMRYIGAAAAADLCNLCITIRCFWLLKNNFFLLHPVFTGTTSLPCLPSTMVFSGYQRRTYTLPSNEANQKSPCIKISISRIFKWKLPCFTWICNQSIVFKHFEDLSSNFASVADPGVYKDQRRTSLQCIGESVQSNYWPYITSWQACLNNSLARGTSTYMIWSHLLMDILHDQTQHTRLLVYIWFAQQKAGPILSIPGSLFSLLCSVSKKPHEQNKNSQGSPISVKK